MKHQDTYTQEMYQVSEAQAPTMKQYDQKVIKAHKSLREAFNTSMVAAGFSQYSIGDEIGKRQEQISKFLTGTSGLKADDIEKFLNATGNLIVVEYLAAKHGKKLVDIDEKEARIRQLENQLEALRSA